MSQENIEILRAIYAHWGRGDLNTPWAFDPEVEFERVGAEGAGGAGRWLGIQDVAVAVGEYVRSFHELRVVAHRFASLDDGRVLVLSKHHAIAPGSGVPYDKEIGDIITLRDGRIVGWRTFWRPGEALEAAGLPQ